MNEHEQELSNKALWIFANFRETVNTIPQKYRGRAWEIIIEYAFGNAIDLKKENNYIQLAVKALLPLLRLRKRGGSQMGRSNNPSGKSRSNKVAPNTDSNTAANVDVNVGATSYITETETKKEKKKERGVFVKPSLDDLKIFIKEKMLSVDADQFYYHYEGNGWMIGRNKMKDWHAALYQWSARNKKSMYTQEVSIYRPVEEVIWGN